MIYPFWRLSEAGPDNLGLSCTDAGLLLRQTPLIERHDGRFAVRGRHEIERLLQRAYAGEVAVDRLMSGLATVASALNANDPCLARIAAVHLKIPDLPSSAVRDALEAEDSLIKYARDEGGSARLESGAASARRRAAKSGLVRADGRRTRRRFKGANCAKQ
jgi:hypothetical protein